MNVTPDRKWLIQMLELKSTEQDQNKILLIVLKTR